MMQVAAGTGTAALATPSGAFEPSPTGGPASTSSVADYHRLTDPAVTAVLETATPLGAEVSCANPASLNSTFCCTTQPTLQS